MPNNIKPKYQTSGGVDFHCW